MARGEAIYMGLHMELGDRFTTDCHTASAILKMELHYNATRFNQMLDDHGGFETAQRLIAMEGASDGFTVLWEAGRLDLSVEALAVLPVYQPLFTDAERLSARRALEDRGFPVDLYLECAKATRPPWRISRLAT